MQISGINTSELLSEGRRLLSSDKTISASVKAVLLSLLALVEILVQRHLGKSSVHSHTSPSQDPHRKRSIRAKSERKSGGQPGHIGSGLKLVDNPDVVEHLRVDKRKLASGSGFVRLKDEVRQVFDFEVQAVVTEYRAEVWQSSDGKKVVAEFPKGVESRVQYGSGVKAQSVYNTVVQYHSSERGSEYFSETSPYSVSEGSVHNFRQECFERLAPFEKELKQALIKSSVIHNDETGAMIDKSLHWIHVTSNENFTLYTPHQKRGKDDLLAIGILPQFSGL